MAAVAVVIVAAAAASAAYLLIIPNHTPGSTTSTLPAPYSVNIAYSGSVGNYLTNGSGFTLYYRTTDFPSNGTSTCKGGCVGLWPVFYAPSLVLPSGLGSGSFGVATRSDGLKQLTFDGWPLYLFTGDKKAGTLNGQGIGGIWFAYSLSSPPTASTSTATSSSTTASSATSSASSSASTTSSAAGTTTSSTTSTTSTTTSSTTTACYYYCP